MPEINEAEKARLNAIAADIKAKSPESWATIETLSKDAKIPKTETVTRWHKIYQAEYLQALPEDQRIHHATRILKTQLAAVLLSSATDYTLVVLDATAPKTLIAKKNKKKMTISNILAYGQPAPEDGKPVPKPSLVKISCFDDRAQLATTVTPGHTYVVRLTGGLEDGVYDCSPDDSSQFKEVATDVVDVGQFLLSKFQPLPLSEVPNNISKGPGDYKLVKGGVIFGGIRNSDKGNVFGRYTIMDDSLPLSQADKGVSIMVDPSQVRWERGSELVVLGLVQKPSDPKYGPSIRGEVVASTFGIPRQAEPEAESPTVDAEENVEGTKTVQFADF